ncbi:DUF983 domain-containing protein [Phenylobacterium montanum]|uniref:DUF983 domain-containing protein n=1 Tax=Phenylobacterium montanum TaxID=2823693 RepID=A0A975FVQ0_9CAUL|nr:DUF983 domain-containing protein [Caulobacter sp. S6]QUD86185.1 DUF983 domain-containing protein [Caulobacter sp. S6]
MSKPNLWRGMARGFAGKCPHCGQGRLFRAYLKVESPCAACGHDNGQYPADDAPPYFTILILGHVVIAPLVVLPVIWTLNPVLVLAVALPTVGALALILLPRVKGAVVGLHWAIHKNEGVVPGQGEDSGAWAPPEA